MQDRVHRVIGNGAVSAVDFIGLAAPPSIQLTPPGLASLKALVAKHKYELIIIDTLEDTKQELVKKDGNAYERDTKLLIPVQQLAKAYNPDSPYPQAQKHR